MKNFISAYQELMQGPPIKEEDVKRHIEQQAILDELLPESDTFFYVIEFPAQKYHFMGKQQVNITGYSNEEFIEKGVDLFFQRVHPEDLELLSQQVYPAWLELLANTLPENRKKIQFQYNYRFKCKNNHYVNLLERGYALELDPTGIPALTLGNVIALGNNEIIPVRATAKILNESGLIETIFSQLYQTTSDDISELTRRELDILRNLATGKTSKQIGDRLFISPHTVDTHRRNLLKKMNCRSVVELTRVAFRNGLL